MEMQQTPTSSIQDLTMVHRPLITRGVSKPDQTYVAAELSIHQAAIETSARRMVLGAKGSRSGHTLNPLHFAILKIIIQANNRYSEHLPVASVGCCDHDGRILTEYGLDTIIEFLESHATSGKPLLRPNKENKAIGSLDYVMCSSAIQQVLSGDMLENGLAVVGKTLVYPVEAKDDPNESRRDCTLMLHDHSSKYNFDDQGNLFIHLATIDQFTSKEEVEINKLKDFSGAWKFQNKECVIIDIENGAVSIKSGKNNFLFRGHSGTMKLRQAGRDSKCSGEVFITFPETTQAATVKCPEQRLRGNKENNAKGTFSELMDSPCRVTQVQVLPMNGYASNGNNIEPESTTESFIRENNQRKNKHLGGGENSAVVGSLHVEMPDGKLCSVRNRFHGHETTLSRLAECLLLKTVIHNLENTHCLPRYVKNGTHKKVLNAIKKRVAWLINDATTQNEELTKVWDTLVYVGYFNRAPSQTDEPAGLEYIRGLIKDTQSDDAEERKLAETLLIMKGGSNAVRNIGPEKMYKPDKKPTKIDALLGESGFVPAIWRAAHAVARNQKDRLKNSL